MKTTRNALFALLLLAAGTVTAASAQVSFGAGIHIGPSGRAAVDLGFFYDNLAPYGNWIQRPNYGWVWTPTAVSTNWRPYEDGHWVWTDQGWTWITDEPYGWATYHYGRWYQDPEIGWAWVPGDQWGPAWVSWQEGADYVGWAPLPPGVDISASYDSGYGYNGGYGSYDYGIGPSAYVFVPERYFLAPSLASYVVPTVQISAFWGQTRNYTSYRREGDRYFNQGVPVDHIQRVIGRSVPRYQVADLQTTDYRQPRARISGNQVQIFRPQVLSSTQVAPPVSRPAARRAVVSAEQFQASHPNRATRGQQVYGSQQQADRYQRRQQQQQGAQPQDQTYQPRQLNQQRPYTQPQQDQYQTNRQRQVDPYNNTQQDQYQQQRRYNDQRRYQQQNQDQNNQQRPPRAVNPQQDRNQQQPPPRANRQQQPPPQSQGNHNGENRGNQNDKNQNRGKAHQNQRDRDRNQNQDQDNRPPLR